MSDDPKEQLGAVTSAVVLNDVRLVEAIVRTRIRDHKAVPDAQLAITSGTQVIHRSENSFLLGARLTAHVVSRGEAPTDNSPVSMMVTFALEYRLPDAARYSDEVLAEFARVNGSFNAWPYLREYVQATASRMNL